MNILIIPPADKELNEAIEISSLHVLPINIEIRDITWKGLIDCVKKNSMDVPG